MNSFSNKQIEILTFPYSDYTALICDGAIRSGKTSIMTISFVEWAMRCFDGRNFAFCGKTVGSAIKNIVEPFLALSRTKKEYRVRFNRSEGKLTISGKNHINYFYLYGGKDESSYMLIQGITLAGVLLDEVALMTRSFVEQAIARCSVEGSKFWFNCNPASAEHWFYREWIEGDNPEKKNALHLHFLMSDNPSLSAKMLQRYETLYSGVFYDRYIKGLWCIAEGLVYPMFSKADNVAKIDDFNGFEKYTVSMDYGIQNPTAMLLWGEKNGRHYSLNEYYHSGRETNKQKTDEEYYFELLNLTDSVRKNNDITLIIDPSASSFIALARQRNDFKVKKAKNDVLQGIQYVATSLTQNIVFINEKCQNTIREFGLYSWDSKSTEDKPIKETDHCLDAVRYYVFTNKILKSKNDDEINKIFF